MLAAGNAHRLPEIAFFVIGLRPVIFREEINSPWCVKLVDIMAERRRRNELSNYRDILEISERIKPEREKK